VEDVIAGLVTKGLEKIASRKTLTSQDLAVLLLHQQGRSISRIEKGMEAIAGELKESRQTLVPLLTQARDIADIRASLERIEAKLA